MITRQQFIHAGAAFAAAPLTACSSADSGGSYEAAVKRIWQPATQAISGELAVQRELVRYATLAPSGHNT